VTAIAVPAEVYVLNPSNSEAMLNAAIWSGSALSNGRESLKSGVRDFPIDSLVEQFAKSKKPPADQIPVCAAWSSAPATSWRAKPARTPPAVKAGDPLPPPSPVRPAQPSDGQKVIRVEVAMVTVPAIVSDQDGKFIPDLKAGDFHIFEGGREQVIDRVIPEAEPFHVVLLLDVSGSTQLKHADIQTAASGFVEALRPEDRVMIASFGSLVTVHSEFSSDRSQLSRAIFETKVFGGTRLYDALDLVITERLDRMPGRKAIVVFTDGVDSQSRLATASSCLARVEESNALVYVIQYDTAEDVRRWMPVSDAEYLRGGQFLLDLSGHSGGRRFNAATVPSLREAFDQIAMELKYQYTLCYYPSAPAADNAFRSIRVTLDRPGARIRARSGYRPAPPPVRDK
jgi:VWFA-related protein